ncbi:hypothetical protein ACLQ29_25195 [Micromonospora sp. DT228]|uniref:helix-hairpin-helix domain-containing protein n=1 Tax=Micromonospora sp. DT228 TaxID=3393443 RepID=UPI003CEE03B5
MVLALLLGLAAGWLLRGRRGVQGNSIVDGDPVAGLAVFETPTSAATTDEARPAAAVDPAPVAVADEPVPVDTISAPAAVTGPDSAPTPVQVPAEAPSTVDPGDMALTEAPPSAPSDAGDDLPSEPVVESTPEPVAADEQPAPAAVIAPRQPADDLPVDTTPADEPTTTEPVAEPIAADLADEPTASSSADDVTTEAAVPAEAPVNADALRTDPTDANGVEAAPTDVDAEPVDAEPESAPSAVAVPAVVPAVAEVPPVVTTAANGAGADPAGSADDFRRIQGIGPKLAAALQDAGVRTYVQLGALDEAALRDLIRAAGLRAAPGLATWPQQARVLAGAGDEMAAVLPGGNPS